MINLLPPFEKKKLQKEFRLRYGIVLLLALLALEIVSFILFIPSYLIVQSSTTSLGAELAEKQGTEALGGDTTQNDLNTIKAEIALLKSKGVNDSPPSQLMAMLLSQKPAGISISHFAYVHTDLGTSAQINGNALTPNDLILFRKLLKDDKDHVKEAKYAQSFINKKTDIDFLLTVDFK